MSFLIHSEKYSKIFDSSPKKNLLTQNNHQFHKTLFNISQTPVFSIYPNTSSSTMTQTTLILSYPLKHPKYIIQILFQLNLLFKKNYIKTPSNRFHHTKTSSPLNINLLIKNPSPHISLLKTLNPTRLIKYKMSLNGFFPSNPENPTVLPELGLSTSSEKYLRVTVILT